MAWPMVDWVIEHRYRLDADQAEQFTSFVVNGVKESELVPLLSSCQQRFPELKFSSLPHFSDGTSWQIELGIRGDRALVEKGTATLVEGVRALGFKVENP